MNQVSHTASLSTASLASNADAACLCSQNNRCKSLSTACKTATELSRQPLGSRGPPCGPQIGDKPLPQSGDLPSCKGLTGSRSRRAHALGGRTSRQAHVVVSFCQSTLCPCLVGIEEINHHCHMAVGKRASLQQVPAYGFTREGARKSGALSLSERAGRIKSPRATDI